MNHLGDLCQPAMVACRARHPASRPAESRSTIPGGCRFARPCTEKVFSCRCRIGCPAPIQLPQNQLSPQL